MSLCFFVFVFVFVILFKRSLSQGICVFSRCDSNHFWLILFALQGCISCGTCSYLELTEDHVLTSAYVKIFRIVTRNAVNKSFWRKKDCSWPPLNKYAMNIWLSSLRIRAHLSWRTGKHLHVLHVLPSRMVGWHNLCSPELNSPLHTFNISNKTYFQKSERKCE